MDANRYHKLMETGAAPTWEEWLLGYHYCPEWDGLLIKAGDMEWGDNALKCRCGWDLPILPWVENEQTPGG